MGVRTTDENNVALYDSVTGLAFGPTFQSRDDADAFLSFIDESEGVDPRELTHADLAALHASWQNLLL